MSKPSYHILHEDDDLLMVNKPAGLLSIPDRHDERLPSLSRLLQQDYERVWTVHRLDRDTSGVLCFARHEEAHRHLSLQFAHGEANKTYRALTEGRLPIRAFELTYPLLPSPRHPGTMVVHKQGKEARTSFRILDQFQHFTWVEVVLHTGRTHQIRVHFQHYGHPLVGDPLYGRRGALFLSDVKGRTYQLGKGKTERPLLARTALHAATLTVAHPRTEEPLTAEAPLPKDLRAVLQQLEKWNK